MNKTEDFSILFKSLEEAKKELYTKFNITTIKGISGTVAKQMIDYLKGE